VWKNSVAASFFPQRRCEKLRCRFLRLSCPFPAQENCVAASCPFLGPLLPLSCPFPALPFLQKKNSFAVSPGSGVNCVAVESCVAVSFSPKIWKKAALPFPAPFLPL